VKNPEQ